MKIGTKLGLLISGLLVAQLATAGFGIGFVNAEREQLQAVVAQQQRDTELVLAVREGFQRQNTAWNRMIIDGRDPRLAARHQQTFETSSESVQVLLDELDVVTTDPQLRALNARFRQVHDEVTPQMRDGIAQVRGGGYDAAADFRLQQDQASALSLSDRQLQQVQFNANTAIAEQERHSQAAVLAVSLVIGMLVLLLAGIAWWMIGRVVRPIVALTRRATESADTRLPEATARIQAMDRHIEAPAMPSFETGTQDELADLAGALTVLQDTAVDLAVQQRRTERDNADTLVNLGRRNQSLLARTLAYVAELERAERDPGSLSQLFRLDHLVTRIRRNAESMLVLAGADQARRHGKPATVERIVQAALGEIEDFTRVTVEDLDDATVAGIVRPDLTHLVAELLENATQFSPASSKVHVLGEYVADGYSLRILDSGLGMDADLLAEANARISDPGTRPDNSARLGHHIVGRLARRNDLRVHLETSPGGGVSAVVTLPQDALVADEAPVRAAQPVRPSGTPLPSRRPPLPHRLAERTAPSDA